MNHLLLLQEDPGSSGTLALALKKRGFMVAHTKDFSSALSLLMTAAPVDVVLLSAPLSDRIKFLSDLHEARPGTPVIFFHEYSSFEYAREKTERTPPGRPLRAEELDRLIRIASQKGNHAHSRAIA